MKLRPMTMFTQEEKLRDVRDKGAFQFSMNRDVRRAWAVVAVELARGGPGWTTRIARAHLTIRRGYA